MSHLVELNGLIRRRNVFQPGEVEDRVAPSSCERGRCDTRIDRGGGGSGGGGGGGGAVSDSAKGDGEGGATAVIRRISTTLV